MARPMCVLLVNDDTAIQDLVRRAMRRRLDLVLTAGSAAQAWHCLEHTAVPIDQALIDAVLPDSDGLLFAAGIRGKYPDIGITLSAESALMTEFRILLKPFTVYDLWMALD